MESAADRSGRFLKINLLRLLELAYFILLVIILIYGDMEDGMKGDLGGGRGPDDNDRQVSAAPTAKSIFRGAEYRRTCLCSSRGAAGIKLLFLFWKAASR